MKANAGKMSLKWVAAVLVLGILSGCNGAAVRALKTYENQFACAPDDFEQMEALVHKYFSGPTKLEFTDTSEAAFTVAGRLNELIAKKCPKSLLKQCAGGRVEADYWYDVDETHSSKELQGPLEVFGVVALTDTNFYEFSVPHPVFITELSDSNKFHKAVDCFSRK